MQFYLNCWVPTLSGYIRIQELKNIQLNILSKYILNEDHEGANNCFNLILEENLEDKTILQKLTRFDKWFIFAFYRAVNISPIIYIQTTTKDNASCNVEIQLFDTLTKLSEINLSYNSLVTVGELSFEIQAPSDLFVKNNLVQSIQTFKVDPDQIIPRTAYEKIFNDNQNLAALLKTYLANLDTKHGIKLIENKNLNINLNDVPLRLYDNTLFFFLRSIYLPFCKGLYLKQYNLIKKLGIDYKSIQLMTPLEGEILLNLHNEEEASKKPRKSIDLH